MQGKSLKEWLDIYKEKTGDDFNIPQGFSILYLAERGFASMKPDFESKMMMVYQTCGDGKFWRDTAELYAAALQFDCIGTICTRPIKPYIRSFGWEILDQQCKDGQYRYLCQDSIGRPILITHKCIGENGIPEYWAVQYLNKKAVANINTFLEKVV